MAQSGTIYTAYWEPSNGQPWRVAFNWEATQDVATNSSTITWELKVDTKSTGTLIISELEVVFGDTQVYHRDDSVHTYAKKNTVLANGTTTVAHDNDGTKTFTCSIGAGLYNHAINKRGSGEITLNPNPRFATLLTAQDFNDEENPTITYSNPAGSVVSSLQACISLDGSAADVAYRDIDPAGSSYTFNLTDAERDVLRAATTGNSRSVIFFVRSVISGSTGNSTLTKTFSIKNPNPTINPTIVDGNSATVALTGDNKKLVRYYSNAQIAFGAAAVKKATLVSKKVTCGGKSLTADGTIPTVESNIFNFSATDSRGNTTEKQVTAPFVEYVKLSCILANSRPDTSGNMTVQASGSYFNGNFGAKSNSLKAYYRYKEYGGTYGSWTEMTADVSGNTYTATADVTGLDYQTTYVFQTYAVDELAAAYSAERSVKATSVFDWSKDDFTVNTVLKAKGGLQFPDEKGNMVDLVATVLFKNKHSLAANKAESIRFTGATSAIIAMQGSTGASYMFLIYQGYGIGGSARSHITCLQKGSVFSYGVLNEGSNHGLGIWNNSGSSASVSVIPLTGTLDSITVGTPDVVSVVT